jgi:hypothetical protein
LPCAPGSNTNPFGVSTSPRMDAPSASIATCCSAATIRVLQIGPAPMQDRRAHQNGRSYNREASSAPAKGESASTHRTTTARATTGLPRASARPVTRSSAATFDGSGTVLRTRMVTSSRCPPPQSREIPRGVGWEKHHLTALECRVGSWRSGRILRFSGQRTVIDDLREGCGHLLLGVMRVG